MGKHTHLPLLMAISSRAEDCHTAGICKMEFDMRGVRRLAVEEDVRLCLTKGYVVRGHGGGASRALTRGLDIGGREMRRR